MNNHLAQSEAPFFEEILRYSGNPLKAFHTPGHKTGLNWEQNWFRPELLARLDLSEISALDWAGSLEKAEDLAAELYQADRSFFLVQGASQGILAIILGAFSPGDTVLVARNCHSSVIHAIILADLIPVYIESDFLADWGMPLGISQGSLRQALKKYPECKGIIITNPTYQGVAESVSHYRHLIGERLLIVDEAHGGYLGWSGLNGFDASEAADAWIQGTHKMLGSLTQTGMLHLKMLRINPDKIMRSLELVTTTSPSYILLASLDSNRRFLATTGRMLFQKQTKTALDFKKQLAKIEPVAVLDNELLHDSNKIVDPWKLCISFNKCGLNGYEVERILRMEFKIQAEYADLNQVNLFMAPWQQKSDLLELQKAIADIGQRVCKTEVKANFSGDIPPLILRPREAAFRPSRLIKLQRAIGQVSATIISPYPPGIPLVGPGELIREQEVRLIETIVNNGGVVRGLSPQGEVRITNCG